MDGWKWKGKKKNKKGYEIDLSRILNTFDDCKDAKLTFKREERHYPELFVNTFSRAAHPALGGLLVKTRATWLPFVSFILIFYGREEISINC